VPLTLTDMNVIRIAWTGFSGGPGVSTFYCDGSAQPDLASLRTFLLNLAGVAPTGVTLTFPSSGESIDPSDGSLVGNWTVATPPATVPGTGSGAVCTAQGCMVSWTTDEIADGRAVKGRTFGVPSAAGVFGTDGLLAASQVGFLNTGANALIAANPKYVVWHRPKKGPKPVGGGPRPIIRTGGWAPITGKLVARKAAVLTSRRD
jgi:hypothetical protein